MVIAKPGTVMMHTKSIAFPDTVAESKISKHALEVLQRLNKAGYKAYLVGGGVRDMLVGLKPKDFDIATNATPEQVKAVFRNCRLIGRRFRLAHILYGREIIEVATFRGHHDTGTHSKSSSKKVDYRQHKGHTKDGRIVRDNVYGTIEEDAVRRDFTINALYLDIQQHRIIDFVDSIKDITNKEIKLIGDPQVRYQEDPVRMLRAVRFAAKLNFKIEKQTAKQIHKLSSSLSSIPAARLIDEAIKLFQGGYGLRCFELLQEYHLLASLFPSVQQLLVQDTVQGAQAYALIKQALINTDERIAIDKSVNPAFFLSVLLWYPMLQLKQNFLQSDNSEIEATQKASMEVIRQQQPFTAIPKRFGFMIKDIWFMQWYMQKPSPKQATKMLHHKRFRAAYDFLLLRVKMGETQFQPIAQWWTDIQEKTEKQQHLMINELAVAPRKKKKQTLKK